MKYRIIILGILFVGLIAFAYAFFVYPHAGTIAYMNASSDLIKVSSPLPGAVVGKNFTVLGSARGTWFFEASFPVQVLDKNGKIIFQIPAQADSDWMTENFVPFHAYIKIPETYIGPVKLILKKDNPAGLPEHDASASFDIVIE